jgi:hypothetical protein
MAVFRITIYNTTLRFKFLKERVVCKGGNVFGGGDGDQFHVKAQRGKRAIWGRVRAGSREGVGTGKEGLFGEGQGRVHAKAQRRQRRAKGCWGRARAGSREGAKTAKKGEGVLGKGKGGFISLMGFNLRRMIRSSRGEECASLAGWRRFFGGD